METSKDCIRVGLLWHSLRSANLGWGALTLSHLTMLSDAAKEVQRPLSARVIGLEGPLSYSPAEFRLDETLIRRPRDLLPGSKLWRAISDCDVILDIGGGDLFSDIYGRTTFYLVTWSKILVLMQRKPLILSPQTIGPFRKSWTKSVATQIARRCDKIFTRDAQSLSLLGEMGIANGAEETVDLAFRLPFKPHVHGQNEAIRFGLNVSGLLYVEALTHKYAFGLKADYPALINRIIATLRLRPEVSIILIPHVVGDTAKENDDLWICQKLAAEFNLEIAPQFRSPIEAKSFISSLDVLAGSRMHATIAALSSGVPVIPLAYTRKFSGVFRSVDYPLVCDLLSQDIESIVANVHDAIDQLGQLRASAAKSNAIAQAKLDRYQEYLVEMMRSLPKKSGNSHSTGRLSEAALDTISASYVPVLDISHEPLL